VNDNNEWTNDNNEYTNNSIGRRRTEDEGERMKTVRSNGWTPWPLVLGILELIARVLQLQIPTVRYRHGLDQRPVRLCGWRG
jgi:hypothetical protein